MRHRQVVHQDMIRCRGCNYTVATRRRYDLLRHEQNVHGLPPRNTTTTIAAPDFSWYHEEMAKASVSEPNVAVPGPVGVAKKSTSRNNEWVEDPLWGLTPQLDVLLETETEDIVLQAALDAGVLEDKTPEEVVEETARQISGSLPAESQAKRTVRSELLAIALKSRAGSVPQTQSALQLPSVSSATATASGDTGSLVEAAPWMQQTPDAVSEVRQLPDTPASPMQSPQPVKKLRRKFHLIPIDVPQQPKKLRSTPLLIPLEPNDNDVPTDPRLSRRWAYMH